MSTVDNATLTRTVNGLDVPVAGRYELDAAHTTVGFTARHLMVTKVRGKFSEVSGVVEIADDPSNSSVAVTIPAASFTTGNDDRDGHVKSADFLDVDNHPELTFRSTAVERKGSEWVLGGDLTIKGVTRPVTLAVEFDGAGVDPWGGSRIAFSATGEIDREDFDITWNQSLETGGVLVSKKVTLQLDVQAVRQ